MARAASSSASAGFLAASFSAAFLSAFICLSYPVISISNLSFKIGEKFVGSVNFKAYNKSGLPLAAVQASASCSSFKPGIRGQYEPILLGVYKGDRSDHGIKGARITINPLGGRTVKEYV